MRALGAQLPSMQSAEALVKGDSAAILPVTVHWLGRSAIMGVGMYAFGERSERLVPNALAGGFAVEVMVLLYAYWKRDQK